MSWLLITRFYKAVLFYNLSQQERRDDLLKQSVLRQSLQQQTKTLCDVCDPAEVHQLQGRWESSLQPYMEAHQLVELRGESLEKLEAFLHTHSVAAGVLQGLRQTVESAGSWDKSRVDELQKDLEAIVPDISRLETLAVNLDGSLCKAHLHLMNGKDTRSSCRSLADSLSVELDTVRNLLGSKQSEAEALGALWSSFRQRKEQLLKTVEDIEEKADKQGLKEPNVHTLQQRYDCSFQQGCFYFISVGLFIEFVMCLGFGSSISWKMSCSRTSTRRSGSGTKVSSWLRETLSSVVKYWEKLTSFRPPGKTPRNSLLKGEPPVTGSCTVFVPLWSEMIKNINNFKCKKMFLHTPYLY